MKIRIKYTTGSGTTVDRTKTAYPVCVIGDRELWSGPRFGKFTISAHSRSAARANIRVAAMPATEAELAEAESIMARLGSSVDGADAIYAAAK